jgi:carbonic anhydrase/acetyltransferase-like protein (isoleucine patch superfamily)
MSNRASRQSLKPQPHSLLPKPPLSVDKHAIISDTAIITGIHAVSISSSAALHPRSRIVSTHGPVTLGRGVVVSARAIVGVGGEQNVKDSANVAAASRRESRRESQYFLTKIEEGEKAPEVKEEEKGDPVKDSCEIGEWVTVECGAIIEARSIGDGTVIDVGVRIGRGAKIGKVGIPCSCLFDQTNLLIKMYCSIAPSNPSLLSQPVL